ncbi:glutathione S-transferase [Chaetomidium leptoderma]|uniref:Glutathione S-transferase n=1 Tax=Chaetomidium leptoderma TaxID=669021 RepID=A0AAN7A0B3_9PEZI|nr:glutathione S-transferase [Chaetomidium leptoderma]
MSQIDTSLLPNPTAAAATLAAAHADPHPLKLYGGWFCPFVQRAWIVLAEKQIPHQYVEINPYKKEQSFLALNPRGLVPTLTIDDEHHTPRRVRVLYESTVVCEYLDEAYSSGSDHHHYGKRLLPEGEGEREVFERARCRLWINHVVTRVVPGFYRLLQHTPDKGYPIEEARGEFLAGLKAFAREMVDSEEEESGKTGPWFLGKRFSLVDVMLAPWAKRLFLIDHYKPGGVGIPNKGERGEDEEVWARWDQWFGAVVERESVKATWSADENYIKAYKRYAEDTTQSEVGQATRQGRSLP